MVAVKVWTGAPPSSLGGTHEMNAPRSRGVAVTALGGRGTDVALTGISDAANALERTVDPTTTELNPKPRHPPALVHATVARALEVACRGPTVTRWITPGELHLVPSQVIANGSEPEMLNVTVVLAPRLRRKNDADATLDASEPALIVRQIERLPRQLEGSDSVPTASHIVFVGHASDAMKPPDARGANLGSPIGRGVVQTPEVSTAIAGCIGRSVPVMSPPPTKQDDAEGQATSNPANSWPSCSGSLTAAPQTPAVSVQAKVLTNWVLCDAKPYPIARQSDASVQVMDTGRMMAPAPAAPFDSAVAWAHDPLDSTANTVAIVLLVVS
jgi:hypothetical protein